jgi:hypothetical protein
MMNDLGTYFRENYREAERMALMVRKGDAK